MIINSKNLAILNIWCGEIASIAVLIAHACQIKIFTLLTHIIHLWIMIMYANFIRWSRDKCEDTPNVLHIFLAIGLIVKFKENALFSILFSSFFVEKINIHILMCIWRCVFYLIKPSISCHYHSKIVNFVVIIQNQLFEHFLQVSVLQCSSSKCRYTMRLYNNLGFCFEKFPMHIYDIYSFILLVLKRHDFSISQSLKSLHHHGKRKSMHLCKDTYI